MIPLRDENPTAGTSIATLAILAVNALAWASVQRLGTEPALSTSVCEWGAIAGDLFGSVPSGTLVPLGPNLACEIGVELQRRREMRRTREAPPNAAWCERRLHG